MAKFHGAFLIAFAALVLCCAGCAENAIAEKPSAVEKPAVAAEAKPADGGAAVDPTKWGDLKGRFVFKDKLPAPAKIAIAVPGFCGKFPLVDETVVIDKDGNVANIMVYLAKKPPDIHPDFEKTAKDKITLDNNGCRFEPHVLAMRAGQTLVIKNSDGDPHNSNVPFAVCAPVNPLIPAGGSVEVPVEAAEAGPTKVSCNIHPWMNAMLLVRGDPYAAVSGKDGKFEIKNVPLGLFDFVVRGEKYISRVNVGGKNVDWIKGRVTVPIKAGANDLGDIIIDISNFK